MSCRVIGRGVENAVYQIVTEVARENGCTAISATYQRTDRNHIVAKHYDKLKFQIQHVEGETVHYVIELDNIYIPSHEIRVQSQEVYE